MLFCDAPDAWGPTPRVMLDDDRGGAAVFPSLFLLLFTSVGIQDEAANREPCSGLGLF